MGSGSSSCVISARLNIQNNATHASIAPVSSLSSSTASGLPPPHVVAFKISANEDCIAVEKFIITALHHHELYISGRRSFNIPHFVELEAFGIPDNAVDPTCCSVFDQIYDSIEPFTIDHVLAVWNILTVAHDAGFAHGDIRLPNCMWSTKDSCVVLIDWSSGRVLHSDPKPSPPGLKFQCPSFVTASVPILTAIDEKKAVEIYRADEAVSMIWLALHAKFVPT